jgi:hypothetical protein
MKDSNLPFLSREQLSFQENTAFAIKIRSVAVGAGIIKIRGFTKEGAFSFIHIPNVAGTEKTEIFNLPDIPIMLTIDDEGKSFLRGACYIRATLLLNGATTYQLAAGYVAGLTSLSYPSVQSDDSSLFKGNPGLILSANPAAGAEVTKPLLTYYDYLIHSIRVTLVAAAAAASRRVHMTVVSGGNIIYDFCSPTDQIISETKTYMFQPAIDNGTPTNADIIFVPIPDNLIIPGGSAITSATLNINAGDDYGVMTIYGEIRIVEDV